MIWKSSLQADLPDLDPTKYGWKKKKIFACNCSADEPCVKGNCSCRKHQISCTFYCKCYETKCYSAWTQSDDTQITVDVDVHEDE